MGELVPVPCSSQSETPVSTKPLYGGSAPCDSATCTPSSPHRPQRLRREGRQLVTLGHPIGGQPTLGACLLHAYRWTPPHVRYRGACRSRSVRRPCELDARFPPSCSSSSSDCDYPSVLFMQVRALEQVHSPSHPPPNEIGCGPLCSSTSRHGLARQTR